MAKTTLRRIKANLYGVGLDEIVLLRWVPGSPDTLYEDRFTTGGVFKSTSPESVTVTGGLGSSGTRRGGQYLPGGRWMVVPQNYEAGFPTGASLGPGRTNPRIGIWTPGAGVGLSLYQPTALMPVRPLYDPVADSIVWAEWEDNGVNYDWLLKEVALEDFGTGDNLIETLPVTSPAFPEGWPVNATVDAIPHPGFSDGITGCTWLTTEYFSFVVPMLFDLASTGADRRFTHHVRLARGAGVSSDTHGVAHAMFWYGLNAVMGADGRAFTARTGADTNTDSGFLPLEPGDGWVSPDAGLLERDDSGVFTALWPTEFSRVADTDGEYSQALHQGADARFALLTYTVASSTLTGYYAYLGDETGHGDAIEIPIPASGIYIGIGKAA